MNSLKRIIFDVLAGLREAIKNALFELVWFVALPMGAAMTAGWIAGGVKYGLIGAFVCGIIGFVLWTICNGVFPWWD